MDVQPQKLADHGGVVAFDKAREIAYMKDGERAQFTELFEANPSVDRREMWEELYKLPDPRALIWKDMGSDIKVLPYVPIVPIEEEELHPDYAAALILEQIKNAGSPEEVRKAASSWLTRITNDITEILRGDEDG